MSPLVAVSPYPLCLSRDIIDQLLISSFVRKIVPIRFLFTGGKDCIYVATLKWWRIAAPLGQ
jgi:hypothetical protein